MDTWNQPPPRGCSCRHDNTSVFRGAFDRGSPSGRSELLINAIGSRHILTPFARSTAALHREGIIIHEGEARQPVPRHRIIPQAVPASSRIPSHKRRDFSGISRHCSAQACLSIPPGIIVGRRHHRARAGVRDFGIPRHLRIRGLTRTRSAEFVLPRHPLWRRSTSLHIWRGARHHTDERDPSYTVPTRLPHPEAQEHQKQSHWPCATTAGTSTTGDSTTTETFFPHQDTHKMDTLNTHQKFQPRLIP